MKFLFGKILYRLAMETSSLQDRLQNLQYELEKKSYKIAGKDKILDWAENKWPKY